MSAEVRNLDTGVTHLPTCDLAYERAVHALRAALLRLVGTQWDRVQGMQTMLGLPPYRRGGGDEAQIRAYHARANALDRARYRLSRLMLAANLASRLPIPA